MKTLEWAKEKRVKGLPLRILFVDQTSKKLRQRAIYLKSEQESRNLRDHTIVMRLKATSLNLKSRVNVIKSLWKIKQAMMFYKDRLKVFLTKQGVNESVGEYHKRF